MAGALNIRFGKRDRSSISSCLCWV